MRTTRQPRHIRRQLYELASSLWDASIDCDTPETPAKRKALADRLEALQDAAYDIADQIDGLTNAAPQQLGTDHG